MAHHPQNLKRTLKWIRTKTVIGEEFKLSKLAKDINLTTRDVSNLLKGKEDLVEYTGVGYRRRTGE